MITKTLSPIPLIFINAAILFSCLVFSIPANASEGERLFQENCIRCHKSVKQITLTPDKICDVLRSGNIRKHRFVLDDNSIQLIVEYIKQQT